MELDDLKSAWKAEIKVDAESEQRIVRQIIHRSSKGIARMVVWEIAIGTIVVLMAFAALVFAKGKVSMFFFKLMIPMLIYALPIYYRLYRSSQFLKNVDYSKDIRSTLKSFLNYYKKTLRLYEWGSYAALVLVFVLFLTDAKFMSISFWLQALLTGYLVGAMFAIRPFVGRFYGRKVYKIEAYLNELGNGE